MKIIIGVLIAFVAVAVVVYFGKGNSHNKNVAEDIVQEVSEVKDNTKEVAEDAMNKVTEVKEQSVEGVEDAVDVVKKVTREIKEFSSKVVDGVEVAVDGKNKLMWVNSLSGCKIHKEGEATAAAAGAKYCSSLEYAGENDWRLATGKEMSNLIVTAEKEGFTLKHINPNCQFMAAQDGFVQTAKNKVVGKIQDTSNSGPSGIRCVRDVR